MDTHFIQRREATMAIFMTLGLGAAALIAFAEIHQDPQARLRQQLRLPAAARDVRDIGNGWHTFKLRGEEGQRTYLRRLQPGIFGDSESVTELAGGPSSGK
jgi:hypothetical protein